MDKATILDTVLNNSKAVLSDIYDEDISITDSFVDLGASSIDRLMIIDDTLTFLSIDASVSKLVEATTLLDLANLIFDCANYNTVVP